MKRKTMIKVLAVLFVIIAPIGFYVFIGPSFEISVTQSWGRVTNDTTEINTVIAVNNPTPFSRWLKKVEFDLHINDFKIASEVREGSVEAKPFGKTEMSFMSFLNNSKIPDLWATYLNRGDIFDVKLTGNVTFSSPRREMVLPIGYKTSAHTNLLELLDLSQPIDIRVGPANLTLKSLTLTWGEVTSLQTEINNVAVIYNPNSYTTTITEINYIIEMNGIKMGEGATNTTVTLQPNTNNNVSFTAVLNNTLLDQWWATHLRNDQVTNIVFKLQGAATVQGAEYDFPIVELRGGASIRILSGTISLGFYIPVI